MLNYLKEIAVERIHDEIIRILRCRYAADGILLLRYTGLLKYILPEVEDGFGVEQKSPDRHHIYDVGTHSIESLRYCTSPDPIIRFATLIHDIGKVKTYKKEKIWIDYFL